MCVCVFMLWQPADICPSCYAPMRIPKMCPAIHFGWDFVLFIYLLEFRLDFMTTPHTRVCVCACVSVCVCVRVHVCIIYSTDCLA